MTIIRKVDPDPNAPGVVALFTANGDDARHARAVIAEGGADLWLAEEEGRLLGVLLGRQMRSSDGELRGGVDNLLVDGGYRRRGIGRRLMEEAEAHYRARDLYGMQLAVSAENSVARSLYDSMGYQVVHRYTRSRRDPSGREIMEPRLRMWKRFEPDADEASQTPLSVPPVTR